MSLRRTMLHQGWTFAETSWQNGARLGFSQLEWLPAEVPGHVHLDLLRAGVIADPFALKQELGCQWVDEADFSYRTEIEWQPDPERPRRVLRFDGLDTCCTVLLNGRQIARHDNMFVPLEIDVRDGLVPGKNEIRVDFASAARTGRTLRQAFLEGEALPEAVERFSERSFVRKAQYMYGWDWGPRLVSLGIWQPVALLEFAARLLDVHVTQEHAPDGRVRVAVRSELDGEGIVVHCLNGGDVRVGDGEILATAKPELWFPNGLGQPHLHTLVSYLCPPGALAGVALDQGEATRRELDRIALDRRVVRFGLRQIRLLREPDAFGQSFEFEVNGRKLWAMGANWIPDDSFPSRITREALRAKLERVRALGMNMLRVWGGGLYESEDFYDACDELGILVWQDFPFACAYYPDQGEFAEAVAREAAVNVKRLRNHASLALWCGNNENLTMYEQRWGNKALHPPRYYGEQLYERTLPEVLARLDPGRPYIPTSPWGGDGDCNQGGIGDQHYWDVWHGRGDWRHYRDSTARFCSEYGFASACSRPAWQTILDGPSELDLRDPIVRWHDKTLKGWETFLGFVALHYPEPQSLEDWTYFSQLNQRDAVRCAVEHYRRSEFCRGSLIWQLNDCWPVQSWALMDSANQPKAAWFELQRLYARELVSIVCDAGVAEVWLVLDNGPSDATLRGRLSLTAHSLSSGEVLRRFEAEVSLEMGQRRCVLRAEVGDLPRTSTLLVARIGALRATALLTEPKLLELPPPARLSLRLRPGQIELETPAPLVDLLLLDGGRTDYFEDNVLTCPEPGRYCLRYHGPGMDLEARSLAGRHAIELSR